MSESSAKALRGAARLSAPASLPLIDTGAAAGYTGSISKVGDNADWDWGIYQDAKGEWVLFEAYGPGCIYNFTQHRYPASEEPTFSFYFDESGTPAFTIRQSEFGAKPPFVRPAADIYEGPEEGGRGPIWVVRSFVPMEFTRYCKVTSSIELKGFDKAKGEGGWGHVTYAMYDSADGLSDFDPGVPFCLPAAPDARDRTEHRLQNFALETAKPAAVLDISGAGAITAVQLTLTDKSAAPEVLQQLRLRLTWDGADTPAVDAPIGTFFGCEYGHLSCDNALLMLGAKIDPGKEFCGCNLFPMPFWTGAKAELYTVGSTALHIDSISFSVEPAVYNRAVTGYFTASPYYEKTANTPGKNSRIAHITGTGHMVYGVLTGHGILHAGCEGDVRVFFDGRRSPEMESDGSESWASYGWGFVTPPQCNPFSAYSGKPDVNSDWSEVRLTLGDSYYFRRELRFELEHGGQNDGGGAHSGQIFCYLLPGAPLGAVTDTLYPADTVSRTQHGWQAEGTHTAAALTSAYPDGINLQNAFEDTVLYSPAGSLTFTLSIDPDNAGAVLLRSFDQKLPRQAARVLIDGAEVPGRIWYAPDWNPHYRWKDDSFALPTPLTAGKHSITVTLQPLTMDGCKSSWCASSYSVMCIQKR